MNRYSKLVFILSIFIYFTGCGVTNKTLNTENEVEIASPMKEPIAKPANKKVKTLKVAPHKIKKRIKTKVIHTKVEKPKEVERVCFDKQGTAHNCNYKIPKPYNNEISKRELYSQ